MWSLVVTVHEGTTHQTHRTDSVALSHVLTHTLDTALSHHIFYRTHGLCYIRCPDRQDFQGKIFLWVHHDRLPSLANQGVLVSLAFPSFLTVCLLLSCLCCLVAVTNTGAGVVNVL